LGSNTFQYVFGPKVSGPPTALGPLCPVNEPFGVPPETLFGTPSFE
jgi:hypothetical protein